LVRIPRTAARGVANSKTERSYALLVLRLGRNRALRNFEGRLFRCGALVEESALWPAPHYPRVPLLIEYAGRESAAANAKPARGHNRARDIRILWRYDRERGEWDELARILSEGSHWYADLAPIVERELVPPDIDHVSEARAAAGRLAALIDTELGALASEGREHALAFLFDEIAGRIAGTIRDLAAGYGPLFAERSERETRRRRERAA
jgi:hypothetical protein